MHRPTLPTGRRVTARHRRGRRRDALCRSPPTPAAAAPTDRPPAAVRRRRSEYGVPESVLLGVSYLESRWDANAGTPSTGGGYGPMHLTDAGTSPARPRHHDAGAGEDPRGDDSRPASCPAADRGARRRPPPSRCRPSTRAAELTGAAKETLRTDPAANIRGGAALLADVPEGARRADGAGSDPAGLVRRGRPLLRRGQRATPRRPSPTRSTPRIRAGRRPGPPTTASGSRLRRPRGCGRERRLAGPARPAQARPARRLECPRRHLLRVDPRALRGARRPATTATTTWPTGPHSQKIEYIVIHDTEGYCGTTLNLVQDPTYVSWHYTLRSVGRAHRPARQDQGRRLARRQLVRQRQVHRPGARGLRGPGHLVHRGDVPHLGQAGAPPGAAAAASRWTAQHIIGHDNVPGTIAGDRRRHALGPGPVLGLVALLRPAQGARSAAPARPHAGLVTINPDFATNQPAFTGCDRSRPGVPALPAARLARR